jgi:rod shape-determining protein MreC
MKAGPGRAISRRDSVLLGACLLLSVGALVLPSPWALGFATAVRETALGPLLWLQRLAEEQKTSRARLRAIEAARDSAALAAQSLAGLRSENAELRALLGLRGRDRARTVAAPVLRQTAATDGRTLVLAAGSQAGVRVGNSVVSPEGLLGLVVSAGPQASVVYTWAHPEFRASGVTEDGSVLGIIAPTPGGDPSQAFLELRGVPYRDTVAVGTLVLTSGLAGVLRKGIPVGRVAGIRREELGWERVYRVRPLANPGQVSHALVYIGPGTARAPADSALPPSP